LAGVFEDRLSSLRHTHATLLFAEDVPLRIVSGRLGHSTIGITGSLYTHSVKGEQDRASEAVATALRRATEARV
jgi:integrase